MLNTQLKVAYLLSLTIAILTFVAATGGLVIKVYRDNLFVTSGWLGNDLVTLVVAFPVLVTALLLSVRGSQRAQLVWLGMLNYTLYKFRILPIWRSLQSLFF